MESPYYGFGDPNAGLIATPEHWDEYYLKMEVLKDNGANYFRYIVCPWSSEIEFETIGDYSERMSYAWEFDRMIEKCKELDLRMHYNMQMHYAFEAPTYYGTTFWDWSKFGDTYQNNPQNFCNIPEDEGYCYRNYLNTEDPIEFFTSNDAKKHYKNRLRYMISRWGYSTSIGAFELMSEINNAGNVNPVGGENDPNGFTSCEQYPIDDPYWGTFFYSPYNDDIATIGPIIDSWQNEMCQYIKEELEHLEHPLAVNYTGPPNDAFDPTYQSPYVDVASYNYYGRSVEKAKLNYDIIEGHYHNPFVDTFFTPNPQFVQKPFMHSEYGPGEGAGCLQQAKYKKALYYTPFIGLAGSAMNWDWQENEFGVWSFINPIREFMEGIPLDEENWMPGEPVITSDNLVEVYYLRSQMVNDNRKLVGVIGNKTHNYYTQALVLQDTCTLAEPNLPLYVITQDLSYIDLLGPLIIPDVSNTFVSPYLIYWYDAQTGSPIDTTLTFTNAFGQLELTFPGILTGSDSLPMIFFEAFVVGSSIKSAVTPQSIDELTELYDAAYELENPQSELMDDNPKMDLDKVYIYPNPTSNSVMVTIESQNRQDYLFELTDQNGKILQTGQINNTNFSLDLSVYQRGVYILRISNGVKTYHYKLVKI